MFCVIYSISNIDNGCSYYDYNTPSSINVDASTKVPNENNLLVSGHQSFANLYGYASFLEDYMQ